MDMKKMLVSVLTTALGFGLGLMVYDKFLSGGSGMVASESMDEGQDEE
jgi:hypothetical protein